MGSIILGTIAREAALTFVHLRVRSHYSLLTSLLKIPQIVERCEEESMPAVGLTDVNLFGALEFATAAQARGIQPIIGLTCRLQPFDDSNKDAYEIALLASTQAGYQNLMGLSSSLMTDTQEQVLDWERLKAHQEGLILLTGGRQSQINALAARGQSERIDALLSHYREVFGDRLYVEMMRPHSRGYPDEALIGAADRLGLPLLASWDVRAPNAEQVRALDALVSIGTGSHIDQRREEKQVDETFISQAQAGQAFADIPDAVSQTGLLAQRCSGVPISRSRALFPRALDDAPVKGRDEKDVLKDRATVSLNERLQSLDLAAPEQDYHARLNEELEVISTADYAGYFLIVADFVTWAKKQGIPVGPGRGSGAAALTAFALGITDLDPIRFGLLFERFLNPERLSMPDFDIDFCPHRRDDVIRYVSERYGTDQVAQIITFGSLQARAAVRDVGRVLGLSYGFVDELARLIPFNPAQPVTIAEAVAGNPILQSRVQEDPQVRDLFDIAEQIEGTYRHASTHAAGVVIGDRPLREVVPLYRDPRSDQPVTQFSMKWVEQSGLLKFDFLGLKTLTIITNCLAELERQGIPLGEGFAKLDDAATFAMLSRGEGAGVFQMEGQGMQDVLKKVVPDRFEDLIAIVALYRPGPMDNIPEFVATKKGEKPISYPHPDLKPVLQETYGVVVYQEQVMQVAQILSGFSLGKADVLRRAMGKKLPAEMAKMQKDFVQSAQTKGMSKQKATHMFALIDKFAGYGFNKAHAACYARLAFETAYLKANHPQVFFAVTMTEDIDNTDRLAFLMSEARAKGLQIHSVDINGSATVFIPEPASKSDKSDIRGIRYGLGALKGVGHSVMDAVVAERKAQGPFTSVQDFARRIGHQLNKNQWDALICAGAFDSLEKNRTRLRQGIDHIIRYAHAVAKVSGDDLFADMPAEQPLDLPDVPMSSPIDALMDEYRALGLFVSGHPVDSHTDLRLAATPVAQLKQTPAGLVTIAGMIVKLRHGKSQDNQRFTFVRLSDSSGMVEVLADRAGLAAQLYKTGNLVVITADLRFRDSGLRVVAKKVQQIEAWRPPPPITQISIRVHRSTGPVGCGQIGRQLRTFGKGKTRVDITITGQEERTTLTLAEGVQITKERIKVLEKMNVVEKVTQITASQESEQGLNPREDSYSSSPSPAQMYAGA
ncbi:MAG: DNA polymerase III subunit alpha [Pseudomonadota bacterium]